MIEQFPEFTDYAAMIEWCMKVRMGEVEASPSVRERAKSITFAFAYSAPASTLGKIAVGS